MPSYLNKVNTVMWSVACASPLKILTKLISVIWGVACVLLASLAIKFIKEVAHA
jgi:hypothetical protein